MIPLVVVISYGQEKCCDIIKDILKANGDEVDAVMLELDNCEIKAYKLNIVTKYYTTQVALFEWDDIDSIPSVVLANIEGGIFYFDPDNETFAVKMDDLQKFVENHNIEAPCLITKNLCENGATFDLKKSCTSQFIIIDLNGVDEEEEDHSGYGEVMEVMRNNIWSNANVSWFDRNKCSNDFELHDESNLEDDDVEKQLTEFEDLLDSIQKFKIISQNLKREDVLNNAEKLAEHFAQMLSED